MEQEGRPGAVDISAFVRRVMVADHGQVFVTIDASAPSVQAQDAVRLTRWEGHEMRVQKVLPSPRGWTLLLQLPLAQ